MIPEEIRKFAEAAALEEHDPAVLLGGRYDRGELTVKVAPKRLAEACQWYRAQGYNLLSSITATDWYPLEPRFKLAYHLYSVGEFKRLRLEARVSGEGPRIDSVVSVWPAANWYERELFDLFGIHFSGHPNLRRILLPEDWEGHPLRKDFPIEGIR